MADLTATVSALTSRLCLLKFHPYLHRNSTSTLASMIRECTLLSRLTTAKDLDSRWEAVDNVFEYWDSEPMESLIDVGVSKIRRDIQKKMISVGLDHDLYFNSSSHYEQGGGNSSYNSSTNMNNGSNSNNGSHRGDIGHGIHEELEDQISALWRGVRIVELVEFMKTNIVGIPWEVIRDIIKSTMESIPILDYSQENESQENGYKIKKDELDEDGDHDMTMKNNKSNNENDIECSKFSSGKIWYERVSQYRIELPRWRREIAKVIEGIIER